jgi:hypothetical protein
MAFLVMPHVFAAAKQKKIKKINQFSGICLFLHHFLWSRVVINDIISL